MNTSNRLQEVVEDLASACAEVDKVLKQFYGFKGVVQYKGIAFNRVRNFVIADVSPLAFFQLTQRVDATGAEEAIIQLYDRVAPLLSCLHEWRCLENKTKTSMEDLEQGADSCIAMLGAAASHHRVYKCRFCTAYVLSSIGDTLPKIGRT